jgi:hypothetical protein
VQLEAAVVWEELEGRRLDGVFSLAWSAKNRSRSPAHAHARTITHAHALPVRNCCITITAFIPRRFIKASHEKGENRFTAIIAVKQ